ncbi:MAG: OmpH family outer membrane protein [Selenomonadaceae bacterium]|nr:OmpH family outer membrane protein [Selenomonadaceae bacterium]
MNFAKKLAATALFAVSLVMTGCGDAQVGSIDVDKVMEEAPRVKTLLTEAEGKIKEAQEKFEQEYGNKEMSEEDATKVQMEFQRKLAGINQAYASQIRSRMDVVIEEVSREKNIDVVINNSSEDKMIFHGAVDVTDDVIKKMQ